jgi:SAM-dependent methyltransferase
MARRAREAWEAKAAFWDEMMGEGNEFQRVLIGPATERLLGVRPDETVLDVACGNGVFSRRLAALGARVVATDFSETFVRLARERTAQAGLGERVEYLVADATDEEEMLSLGIERFDAAVCSMALMDMPAVDPLMRALRRLLKPDGRFVFSVQHPAFNSSAMKWCMEEENRDGRLVRIFSVKISGYLRVASGLSPLGQARPGEPVAHPYFHKPIGELLGACFRAGLVVDGLEEPAFPDPEEGGVFADERPRWWISVRSIPPVLVARARPT